MSGERRLRILGLLVAGPGANEPSAVRLCEVCREVLGLNGAGIMLMSGDTPAGSLCTTDEISKKVEDLQYLLGEGPCVDAYEDGRPVLEPDLRSPTRVRWAAFSAAALEAGVRAVFGFPIQVGAVRLGALNLYRDQPGPITDDQHADALLMAEICAQTILTLQAGQPRGVIAAELEAGSDFQFLVHQAAGMISMQLDVSVGVALIRLRGYAFAHERLLVDVARDVVDRLLRFDDNDSQP